MGLSETIKAMISDEDRIESLGHDMATFLDKYKDEDKALIYLGAMRVSNILKSAGLPTHASLIPDILEFLAFAMRKIHENSEQLRAKGTSESSPDAAV